MSRDPEATRSAILDSAEALILDHGFAGTTVDAVVDGAGVTKGAFFHHFESKSHLAHALVERYAALDAGHLEEGLDRAERLSPDPLHQVLIFVGLFQERMEKLAEPYPGCLFAAYCYQTGLLEEPTLEVVRSAMLTWRERLGEKLREAVERHPPRRPVEVESLADMLTVIFEGAFILSKTLGEPAAVGAQLGHYRRYLELLFGVEEP